MEVSFYWKLREQQLEGTGEHTRLSLGKLTILVNLDLRGVQLPHVPSVKFEFRSQCRLASDIVVRVLRRLIHCMHCDPYHNRNLEFGYDLVWFSWKY